MSKLIGFTFLFLILTSNVQAQEIPEWVKNEYSLRNWLQSQFHYQPYKSGRVECLRPEEVVKNRGGDCRDFACLTNTILNSWTGYSSEVYGIFYKDKVGHSVCLFQRPDGKWYKFSNTDLIPLNVTTKEEAIKSLGGIRVKKLPCPQ